MMARSTPSLEPSHLTWFSIASTGSDPRLDHILEIAFVVTDWSVDLNEETGIHLVLQQTGKQWESRLDDNPTVKQIHTRSGLLRDVHRNGVSTRDAYEAIVQTLGRYGNPQDFMLAGDDRSRQFIRATWPHLDEWFRYPVFDPGTLVRSLQIIGRQDLASSLSSRTRKKRYRVMDEVKYKMDETRTYLRLLSHVEEM